MANYAKSFAVFEHFAVQAGRGLLVLCLLLGCFNLAFSQESRYKWVAYRQTAILLDSLTVLSGSVQILYTKPIIPLQNISVKLLPDGKSIKLSHTGPTPPDSVSLVYKVLNLDLSKRYFNRSQAKYDSGFYTKPVPDTMLARVFQLPKEELFGTNLQKAGSLTRGISVGNTQSVFVNSALNLQLNGMIAEDLHLSAVISDQNVPFQPEGNTQQIQEFDRALIELSHNNFILSAGDLVLENKKSHFLKYYKNVTGGSLQTRFKTIDKKNYQIQSALTYSLAKGQFFSYFLPVSEGVQGPYQLKAENPELFIIIMAGSEKIYLDGELLKRGFNQDYVIDYNNAELVFNANVLITKFSRVRVEFEYSNQNYNRSILNFKHEHELKRIRFYTNFYQEKDLKNQALSFSLSDFEKSILAKAGNSTDSLRVPNISQIPEFTANQVLYTTQDTLISGEKGTFYRQANREDSIFFSLKFSFVGQNQGHYEPTAPTSNGRLYKFVGFNKGSYLPVSLLPAPNSRAIWVLGAECQVGKKQKIGLELARSYQDQNLFSDKDNVQNQGFAGILRYSGQGIHHKNWQLSHNHSLELNQANFRAIDRFRAVEFDRDWSVNVPISRQERIAEASYTLLRNSKLLLAAQDSSKTIQKMPKLPTSINLRATYRQRVQESTGYQVQASATHQIGLLRLKTNAFKMNSTRTSSLSDWQRIYAEAFAPLPQLPYWLGYIYTQDKNKVLDLAKDSITGTAMNFDAHRFYLQSLDTTAKQSLFLSYETRQDFTPKLGDLKRFSQAQTYQAGLKLLSKHQSISLIGFYRHFDQQDSNAQTNTLNGRLDWSATALKGMIKSELLLTVASAREALREFVFVQVDAGQGTHTWRDDNQDNLQQVNEFYEALNPDERNFVKFWIPTARFLTAYSNDFMFKLAIQPPRVSKTAPKWKRALAATSWQNALQARKKVRSSDILERFLPLYNPQEDNLLSEQRSIRSQFFYMRNSPKQGFELSYFNTFQKNLLLQGFEQRGNYEYRFLIRRRVKRFHFTRLTAWRSGSQSASDFMQNRNYSLQQWALVPEYSYQPSATLRLLFKASWQQKINELTLGQSEKAILTELNGEIRRTSTEGSSITTQLRLVQIRFNGQPNTPAAYDMLEALQNGTNWLWQLNWQRKVLNGLRLNLIYNGRKSANSPIVHFGNVQVTALF
ncbi:MAG: hypothetical protein EAZ57_00925 [Cytophagales bacterium]|nr:MAG: hypothetical protein EAZ57_00925 [Cytophagales bacterium]